MSLKSLNFKLTLLFLIIFSICSFIIFGASYVFLFTSIRNDETSEFRHKLLDFLALYQIATNEMSENTETFTRRLQQRRYIFVRVYDQERNTLFLHVNDDWITFEPTSFEGFGESSGGDVIRLETKDTNQIMKIASLRLPDGNYVQVGIDASAGEQVLRRFKQIFIIIMIPLLALGFLGGYFFSKRSLLPVRKLIAAIQDVINTGQMDTRIESNGSGDELDDLVVIFNQMLTKIEMLIGGMKGTIDNVAHDLKTPLTRLRSTAEFAINSGDEAAYKDALEQCLDESEKIITMLRTLMDISEAESGVMKLEKKRVDLKILLHDISDLYRYTAEEKGIEVIIDVSETIMLDLDLNRMRQVIANLLDNAIKYTDSGGKVFLKTEVDSEMVRVVVEDSGIGISPAELDKIWDRLYRSDSSRSKPGLGLGLGLVRAIINAHGGEVMVKSVQGTGSIFSFTLPASLINGVKI
jgi:signal transduction histidine kinase